MGFFKSIGNAFKKVVKAVTSTVGKVLGTIAAVVAAPFTGGLSLLAIPALFAAGRNNVKSLGKFTGANPIGEPIKEEPVKRFPIKEPKVEPKIDPIQPVEIGIGKGATTGEKENVTLFGYYSKINFVTIPVDNDFGNIVVVEDTYFPYVAVIDNHTPSNGLRYVSKFTFDNLLTAYQNNLDKVLYDLDKDNGNFAYINFNWGEFVDKYLSQTKGLTTDNGRLKWTLTPDFMLKWLDGDSKPTFILDYSYGIPAGVKTVFDLEGDSNEATEAPTQKATYSKDPNKITRLQNLLGTIGSGVAYANLALATAGQIKSRFQNASGAIKNLSDTAKDLQGKFNDVKGMLTKDYINGKVADLKSLVNKSLPKKGSFKSFFTREKSKIITGVAKLKEKLKRRDKDTKTKLSVSGTLGKIQGGLDKVSSKLDTLPKIPKGLTKAAGFVAKVSAKGGGLSGGLSFGSLVSTALPGLSNLQVPSFKNINWANPLDALDGITGGLEAINSIGQKVVNTNFDINVPKGVGPFYAMNEKEAKIAAETALAAKLAADFAAAQIRAEERLQNNKNIKIVPIQLKSLTSIQPPPIERILAARPTITSANKTSGPFVVQTGKAFFHSSSNSSSKRAAYITKGESGTFTKIENNFGYLTFTNTRGAVTQGWISLSDVRMS
jgi:hypothetical protein